MADSDENSESDIDAKLFGDEDFREASGTAQAKMCATRAYAAVRDFLNEPCAEREALAFHSMNKLSEYVKVVSDTYDAEKSR